MKTSIIVFLITLLVGFVVFPFVVIWALNVLFALSIIFTFKTWFATAILLSIIYILKD